ncbi:MAG: DNA/RNA nuclease SfsA [Bdellovibrionales bacterium]
MDFKNTLQKGTLLKRYKRFFADIEFKGEVITAHVPNTGSMKTIPLEKTDCYFSTSDDPKRKLKYTLEFVSTPTGLAGVNTRTPNTIVHEALLEGLDQKFDHVQPEVKINDKTRIDFVLWTWTGDKNKTPKKLKYPDYLDDENLKLHFIEVKNVSMAEDTLASFPDGVTERGTKHLNELIDLQKGRHSTEILFVLQRENIKNFTPAADIDPVYADTLRKAKKEHVKISAFSADMTNKKVRLKWTDSVNIKL